MGCNVCYVDDDCGYLHETGLMRENNEEAYKTEQ
jgi:hypothetical protein